MHACVSFLVPGPFQRFTRCLFHVYGYLLDEGDASQERSCWLAVGRGLSMYWRVSRSCHQSYHPFHGSLVHQEPAMLFKPRVTLREVSGDSLFSRCVIPTEYFLDCLFSCLQLQPLNPKYGQIKYSVYSLLYCGRLSVV